VSSPQPADPARAAGRSAPPADKTMGQSNLTESTPAPSGPAFVGLQKLPSLAGADAPITGKLSFSAPTRIDGALRGEVRSTALLVIGERGSVDGTLRPTELVVLGHVRGEVQGAERVEIGPGGRISGRLETRVLVVSEGGILDAYCVVRARGGD
jgi:cytoskeletal protein CcmA (bactofilin family)